VVKDLAVGAAHRVLVVDGLAETEEVLRAVLEPRGMQVDRVRGDGAGQMTATSRPSVVVLHVEEGPAQAQYGWDDVPRILIGATKESGTAHNAPDEHFLQKPFHYGELIRAIEQLLAAAAL
jgi:DNA-binding response OmpR family regulator